LKAPKKIIDKKSYFLFPALLLGITLSALSLLLYLLLPLFISSNYYQKSLKPLRSQAGEIKKELTNIISEIRSKQSSFSTVSFPTERNEIFDLLKKSDINTEREGIGYYNSEGKLGLWLGKVIDLTAILQGKNTIETFAEERSSFLIKDKASVFLVSPQKVNERGYIVFYRLLAFEPQFKTRYLREYQFLEPKLQRNLHSILYYDYREDISGFERLFSRHEDEYIGQPALQDKTQTLFFPLRNEKKKIMALVTLGSPPLASFVSTQKENLLLAFYLLFGTTLVLFLFYLTRSTAFYKNKNFLPFFLFTLTLISLRLTFLSLSRLEAIKSLPIFSPSLASFLSIAHLTKSPGDIFLTSFFLLSIISCLFIYIKNALPSSKNKLSFSLSFLLNIAIIFFSILLCIAFLQTLKLLIFNSNINLLSFAFSPAFILLHLSILFLFLSFVLIIFIVFRMISLHSSRFVLSLAVFAFGFGSFIFLFKEKYPLFLVIFQTVVAFFILIHAFFPEIRKRNDILVSAFLLSTLFLYLSLHNYSSNRNKSLIQNTLKNMIASQEDWGDFLASQSIPEIEERAESILSFFNNPEPSDFAQTLWSETSIAKFNWYSSLEIWNSEEKMLSRFSLNIPELYPFDFDLPASQDWSIFDLSSLFLGKEKYFIVEYKDWFDKETPLGRIILILSVDYDMLPILYTANPYFELTRVTSLPSLTQLDLGFIIFDLNGKLLFNPHRISTGISPSLLERIWSSKDSVWSSFKDKNKNFSSFYFKTDQRIYSFFIPKKNFINHSVEFLKLLFIYIIFFLFSSLLINIVLGRKKLKNPLWSFSNKVYTSFIAIAIISLLIFAFFTRSFLERIFAQQYIEKAEIHANFAHRVMEDFIFRQQPEKYTPVAPPEDLVLWISSTINNDVNLYKEGKLYASSRREFYDSGLLPELIDGEIYYEIQFENNPFYTRIQKIGDYSFHTLTIPFFFLDSFLLISLPFPFEQQEISKATGGFLEFLVFISVFFVIIVLLFARGMGAIIITPIKKLLAGTREVSLGNLEVSIEHKPQDEMRTLIDGFNAMIKNLKKHQQDLTEMSKTVAWADLARKVAHEIKNPLTPIQLSAEHLLKVYSDKKGDFDKALKESAFFIIKEVENLKKIAHEFLEASKEKTLKEESFDFKTVTQETALPYKKMLSERIKFKETYEGEDFGFKGDKDKIRIALRNIFINAIEAIRDKGEIEVKLKKGQKNLILEIKDTGMGMEKVMLKKVFEPYFSTKDAGTGLGLSIAKKIIEGHGGSIQISSVLRKGTKVLIKFPLV